MGIDSKKTEINIIGENNCDAVLYLVRILQWFGRKTLICDLTRDKHLKYSIPIIEGFDLKSDIYDYSGIGYTYLQDADGDYDTYIYLYDLGTIPRFILKTLIVTEEKKESIEGLEDAELIQYCHESREVGMLIKNTTGSVDKMLSESSKRLGIQNYFQVPVDKKNYKMAILSEFKDKYKFDKITTQYKEALAGMVKMIFKEISYKEIDNAIKKAGGGKYKP